ncbi:hypothetical protein NDU88_003360 [Pleurodeles waltl]|uniref:Uncharacterized protein n=1 Tax=Pleurodeles waltl TaxID=8319 RepID=A0AAV7LF49_PLEWA|nr:hypothetical protein NDU88_003360 [Pleurodeles waltl]
MKEGSGRLLVLAVCRLESRGRASLPGLAGRAWIGAWCSWASAVPADLIDGDRTGECRGGRPLFITSYLAPAIRAGDPGVAFPAHAIDASSPRSCGAYSAAGSSRT